MHTDFACLAPNRMLSQHLLTVISVIVLRYAHLCVYFGTNSYSQLAPINKIGILVPFTELSWKYIKGPLLVGQVRR